MITSRGADDWRSTCYMDPATEPRDAVIWILIQRKGQGGGLKDKSSRSSSLSEIQIQTIHHGHGVCFGAGDEPNVRVAFAVSPKQSPHQGGGGMMGSSSMEV
ncbi:hypothetical protein CP533_2940 [Ophiocordyceps camponoti-saundersi (nom. inval.)]|nr:hypothetical protein CP533_2940 [Ophiocordyceps camponoti-saundersi (nom. inval.)]